MSVGTEDVRENGFAVFHTLNFGFAIFKGLEVVVRRVNALTRGNAKLLLVAVRINHRYKGSNQNDENNYDKAGHSQLVFSQATHTVLKEGGALSHSLL